MFKDWDQVPEYLKSKILDLVEAKWIQGYPDGTIRVKEPVDMERLINALHAILVRFEESSDFDRFRLMKDIANSVVEVRSTNGIGAGVVVGQGKVITNAHVVGSDAQVLVRWSSPIADKKWPRVFNSYNVVKRHEEFDLALIDVPIATEPVEMDWIGTDFVALSEKHFSKVVYTQGSPLGVSGFLTKGLFGGITFQFNSVHFVVSCGVNPGNSGGGVFTTEGKLIGLIVAKPLVATNHPQVKSPSDDMALVIPSFVIDHFLKDEEVS